MAAVNPKQFDVWVTDRIWPDAMTRGNFVPWVSDQIWLNSFSPPLSMLSGTQAVLTYPVPVATVTYPAPTAVIV